jgi:multiple sugar transport system substrate-binding protein
MTRKTSPLSIATSHTVNVSRRRFVQSAAATSITASALGSSAFASRSATAQEQVNLVILTHWGEQNLLDVFQPILDEYQQQNPNVTIELQTVAFSELLNRITTGQLGGDTPDAIHFYNLWLPEFAGSSLLATPPDDVVSDVQTAYAEGTISGASFNDQLWGYPTEVNVWQLLYNKQLLADAGVANAPETWDEFKEAAAAVTKQGTPGLGLLEGWDSGVVHPWTSLLWSNGGEYVAEDASKALFNSQEGIDTLQLQLDMIKDGSAITSTLEDADFLNGLTAMTFMPNFYGADLRAGMQGGIENVGVAPIPHTEGNESIALQYEWLWGVSQASQQQEEAWRFLQWLNGPRSGGGAAASPVTGVSASPVASGAASSPMGDFLTSGLNAIPGRTTDQQAHQDVVGDPFVAPFVDALETARTEPIIGGAQEIKTALQKQIESAWAGQKAPDQALNDAADEANRILSDRG